MDATTSMTKTIIQIILRFFGLSEKVFYHHVSILTMKMKMMVLMIMMMMKAENNLLNYLLEASE